MKDKEEYIGTGGGSAPKGKGQPKKSKVGIFIAIGIVLAVLFAVILLA